MLVPMVPVRIVRIAMAISVSMGVAQRHLVVTQIVNVDRSPASYAALTGSAYRLKISANLMPIVLQAIVVYSDFASPQRRMNVSSTRLAMMV